MLSDYFAFARFRWFSPFRFRFRRHFRYFSMLFGFQPFSMISRHYADGFIDAITLRYCHADIDAATPLFLYAAATLPPSYWCWFLYFDFRRFDDFFLMIRWCRFHFFAFFDIISPLLMLRDIVTDDITLMAAFLICHYWYLIFSFI